MAEEEEGKLPMASGGLTEEDEKFMHALHLLGIKPKLGSVEDVTTLLYAFGVTKEEPIEKEKMDSSQKYGAYNFPKLSVFYGEEGKGDVTWETFQFEIEALLCEKIFRHEQILLGIRRACKGKAGDKIRRLGPEVTVHDIIDKFDCDYGSVETREMVMKTFYSCQQKENESVASYACRLEEIFDSAIHLKALKRSDTIILKEVLHAGLNKKLKLMSMYQCDKLTNYDDFKREIRKLETNIVESSTQESRKTCKPAVIVDTQSREMTEVKKLLEKLNNRIDNLEKEREERNTQPNQGFYRGRGRGGGYRGRIQGNEGRGNYQQQRPLGNQNFQPTCYNCNQKGHIQRNCPLFSHNNSITCYNCKQQGHRQMNCPNA